MDEDFLYGYDYSEPEPLVEICNITGLIPDTLYKLAIQGKPITSLGEMYWSEEAKFNFTTAKEGENYKQNL